MHHFFYRFKYRYGRFLPLTKPVDITLELSSHCNQACGYCYHADPKNLPFTKGFMSLETANKIIYQAGELGVNSIKLNSKGESTLNPHFLEITHLAKFLASGSTFIDRITNSNFKFANNRDDIFEGLANQTKVKISFDSFEKIVMETQRAGSNHELALKNIDKFYNWPGRKNEMIIQAVRTQLNKDEDIYGSVKKRWPSAGVSIRDVVSGRLDTDISALETRKRDLDNRESCLQAHVRLIFNKDGIATACCPDIGEKLQLGDIRKNTVKEIFNSYEAKTLRKSLLNKEAFKKDPCLNCSSFESYKNFKPSWNS